MNYLAHALLAEPYEHSLIGNIAGDLIKGPLARHNLHPRVAQGVRRHRAIDALTDSHPLHRELRALFPGVHRRTSGIVLDVLFDHFLCAHWERFCVWQLDEFTAGVYAALRRRQAPLPEPLVERLDGWVSADWLRVCETRSGLDAVLLRLEKRLSGGIPLSESLDAVDHRWARMEQGFHEIFGSIQLQTQGM
ncbi:MAG: ACP phosphodiesterase [Pseudomonadota bacterium]